MAHPPLALGTMNFGKRTLEKESLRIVDRALDLGISIFDTANAYNDGESERILGRALKRGRGQCTIATKCGLARVHGKAEGLSRANLCTAVEASLKRLDTDCIDIQYLHAPDHATPIEETLDAIATLIAQGKIRDWGISNYASWQILEMLHLCDARGLRRPIISQVIYNLLIREIEIEHLAFTGKYNLHTTVYNPLAGGLLTGKHVPGRPEKGTRFDTNRMYVGRYWSERMFALVELLRAIAHKENIALTALAYAWVAGRSGVGSILVGPTSVEQLDVALAACKIELSPEALSDIEKVHVDFQGTDTNYVR